METIGQHGCMGPSVYPLPWVTGAVSVRSGLSTSSPAVATVSRAELAPAAITTVAGVMLSPDGAVALCAACCNVAGDALPVYGQHHVNRQGPPTAPDPRSA